VQRDLLPDLPLSPEVIAVEGAQRADGLVDGGGLELPALLQMDEEVEDLAAVEAGQIG
jgi:hypothetical protein